MLTRSPMVTSDVGSQMFRRGGGQPITRATSGCKWATLSERAAHIWYGGLHAPNISSVSLFPTLVFRFPVTVYVICRKQCSKEKLSKGQPR